MRSLRTRFFLISWPLVVAAVALVAFGVDRWTIVELERMETGPRERPAAERASAWADSLAAAWGAIGSAGGHDLAARLAGTLDPAPSLVVLDDHGTTILATEPTLRVVPEPGARPGAIRRLRRAERTPEGVVESELALSGTPIRAVDGQLLGELIVIPATPVVDHGTGGVAQRRREGLRRRIWATALVASLAAAAAALLLAGPLVRQVRGLAEAASSISAGDLSARVRPTGGDELASLGRSFDAMAEALARADAHKRNLVSDVAHELRTPLTNIVGIVEAMQDGLREPNEATLGVLRGEIALLTTLVSELQELSLAESGQLAFDLEPVDAVAAARAAVEAIAPSRNGVEVNAPSGTGAEWVKADARRLAQVLRNLLRNAITHTPSGGAVTVTVEPAASTVSIRVTDTGRGIPPEHLARVFDRFHRVDPSRDRASGGMGLGLALVQQLVTGMGGSVHVTSELGHGSSFDVVLSKSAKPT